MSDLTAPDPASPTAKPGSIDGSARLANLTTPRPVVASIWQRREAAPTVTDERDGTPEAAPTAGAPKPAAESSAHGAFGRLTHVSALELWTDASAMATWLADNPEAMAELIELEGLRFHAPNAGTVLGATADGGAVCVVCEVGPSSDEGLGALLRTAAVQDGGIVVWLNGGPDDTHVAALSWLNRATPPRFFLAKASGVRIDGSASAPMFKLLARPRRATEPVETMSDAPQRRVEDHVPED